MSDFADVGGFVDQAPDTISLAGGPLPNISAPQIDRTSSTGPTGRTSALGDLGMSAPSYFAKCNTDQLLTRTLIDELGNPIPLAPGGVPAVVTLRLQMLNTLSILHFTMTNLDTGSANTGQVSYLFRPGDVMIDGLYRAEYHAVYGDGTDLTVPRPGYELMRFDAQLA